MIYPKQLVLNPPPHTKKEIGNMLRQIKGVNKKQPILEMGAGTGRLTIPLLKTGFKVDAVEPDEKSARILEEVALELNLKGLKIYKDIPNKKYSAIVGTDVLHHIDIEKYLNEFYKQLKFGGILCFSEPNGGNLLWYIQPQVFLMWNLEKGIRETTNNKLKNYLANTGFEEIKIEKLWRGYRLLIFARRKK